MQMCSVCQCSCWTETWRFLFQRASVSRPSCGSAAASCLETRRLTEQLTTWFQPVNISSVSLLCLLKVKRRSLMIGQIKQKVMTSHLRCFPLLSDPMINRLIQAQGGLVDDYSWSIKLIKNNITDYWQTRFTRCKQTREEEEEEEVSIHTCDLPELTTWHLNLLHLFLDFLSL